MDPWLIYRDYVKHIVDGGYNTPEFADAMPGSSDVRKPGAGFRDGSRRNFEGG